MGTVVFTSPRTLRVLGLQKLLFPFIFHGNVSLYFKFQMIVLVEGSAQNQNDEEVILGMAAYLTLVLIVMMSFNIWTIIVAQRARKEIGN